MLQIFKEVELAIPSDVTVTLHSRQATVKGPRGELTKVRLTILGTCEDGTRISAQGRGRSPALVE
jgi:ribosomal protein L6P/L9E